MCASPRKTPCGAGLPQPMRSATALSTARLLRMLAHQLAAELELVLADRLGKLVHEAFHEDAVLVDVHAPPESRQDVRVAHRVVDQQVGHGVAEGVLARLGRGPGTSSGSRPFWSASGRTLARIDWPESRMCRPVRLLLASNPPVSLHCIDRVEPALQHVLLTRPQQLDRRAGHLLRDVDRLRGVVVEGAAPAEPAAEVDLVHLDTCWPAGRTPPRPLRRRLRRSASDPIPRTCRP